MDALPARVHFAGVGGVGMAGVAWLLHRLGCDVSGCDAKPDAATCAWLRAEGVSVLGAHDPAHVGSEKPDLLVRTPAVHDDNPELAAARAAGVPVAARGEVLAALSGRFRTAAVCGSHGKTTTSTFLAAILRALAPAQTWWCIGGTSPSLGAVAGCGAAAPCDPPVRRSAGPHVPDAPLLVAEADESDGTLALYEPALLVVTNVDLDHVDRFPSVDAFEEVFRRAIARTRGPVVFCADAPRASALVRSSGHAPAVSFGFSAGADFRILDWAPDGAGGQRFSLAVPAPGAPPVGVHLPVPGRHNALNAAAAVAAAAALGFPPDAAARALERAASLPARRFERVGSPAGFEVVSDYSHHPSEIRALVETARGVPHRRLVGVFQPHRFTRTKTFLADFPPAFSGLDALVLCPVYAASEPPLAGGSAADLYAAFRAAQGPAAGPPVPVYARSLDEAADWFRFNLREGDLVLVVGAGDVDSLAPRIAAMRPAREPPPAPRLGGYGTAAPVARLVEADSWDELRDALLAARAAGEEPAVLGAGTNAIVAATGCARPVVRLRPPRPGAGWKRIDAGDGGAVLLDADAALPGAALLAECRRRGWSGLEALVGVPGTVGGWLAMNAGTRSGSFCDRVEAVVAMAADGSVSRLGRADLRAGYRTCPGLGGRIALAVRLRLDPATPEAVDARMRELAAKRFDFGGLRTCGSVFRNPPAPQPPAGKLADDAGCKGLRVGGARVSDRHANVIAADADATASDVLALVDLVRDRVRAASGVELVPEIRVLR
ncbi:MAG: FAD-binding protein [Kiritimatiellae bacterium]|nr:FAD-binding protein [Kiritimatiellia bacterium]